MRAKNQPITKQTVNFFFLPGTHLKTFKVQLLGPTLTHFFSLKNGKKGFVGKARTWESKRQTSREILIAIAGTRIFCSANEWRHKMRENSKIEVNLKDSCSRARCFDNYHFLTRSTESITRLTSSLARLRVSKRIMPLLFIMAAVYWIQVPG